MEKVCLVGFPAEKEKELIANLKGKYDCVVEKTVYGVCSHQDLKWILFFVPISKSAEPIVLGYEVTGGRFVLPYQIEKILSELLPEIRKKAKGIDHKLVEAFIDATTEVLAMMAGIEVKHEEIIAQKDTQVYGDVSGIIGFTDLEELGGELHGSAAIALPINIAKKIVANMLMIEPNEVDEEGIRDGIGELINMIAGDAKSKYQEKFKISLPTVVTGKKHTIGGSSAIARIVVKFSDPDGEEFYLQICLEEKK